MIHLRSDIVQHINDLLFFINEAKLANFAEDNTICAVRKDFLKWIMKLVRNGKRSNSKQLLTKDKIGQIITAD